MERFKALEKEMKMKAFSKEGLIAAARLDPAEKARRDIIDWIVSTIDELSRQIEQTEAEAEQLQASGKKKKAMGDRLSELDQLNERRQWHIGRLEIVQRMFENGQINNEQVEMIQEDVKYFVEANTEEDFDFDLGIYDELNLQEGEEDYNADYGAHGHEDSSNIDTNSVADTAETPSKSSKADKKSKDHSDDTPPSPVQTKRSEKKSKLSSSEHLANVSQRLKRKPGKKPRGRRRLRRLPPRLLPRPRPPPRPRLLLRLPLPRHRHSPRLLCRQSVTPPPLPQQSEDHIPRPRLRRHRRRRTKTRLLRSPRTPSRSRHLWPAALPPSRQT